MSAAATSCRRKICLVLLAGLLTAAAAGQTPPAEPTSAPATLKDPVKDVYTSYVPDFVGQNPVRRHEPNRWLRPEGEMKLSSEATFFTLTQLNMDARADALVEAALAQEARGQYRDALKMYQMVIEQFPSKLYRVSRYGIYIPVAQYCQRRILGFPPADLQNYRTLYDARAREAFEQARRQYSLIGLSEIADGMLATSYGGRALVELGNAQLDNGHYLAALEYFTTVRDFVPDAALQTAELALKIEHCQRMIGATPGPPRPPTAGAAGALSPEQLDQLRQLATRSAPMRPPFFSQMASSPSVAADDYTLFPPTDDALAVTPPTWERPLPGARLDFFVYTQPVITENSVVCRHKNIVYCRSILNGELRWTCDIGGRATWQNWPERQYPQEDLLVQDGLVFATLAKGGPSLVAIDEVTGQIRWAYGPMVASNEEESRMRFEAAPAGGPRTIYAGYVLDNIEGETHLDSEYGLMAFESTTGRLLWRTPLCRLLPGKFSAGFTEARRNRIRSFTSPPLYHEGTVYYTTNAGALAAVDSQSGRVKWLTCYPYCGDVHDATRVYGSGGDVVNHTRIFFTPHSPMFWYNQRPLLVGEKLYVLSVDTSMLMCFDRRTGRVLWSVHKGVPKRTGWDRGHNRPGGTTYLLGPLPTGELALVYSLRDEPVQLIDPDTGQTVWSSLESVKIQTQPVLSLPAPAPWLGAMTSIPMNASPFELAARPFLTQDCKMYLTSFTYYGWPIFTWASNLCEFDLRQRKVTNKRLYLDNALIGAAERAIRNHAPPMLKALEDLPIKKDQTLVEIANLKKIVADTVPENEYGPLLPFSRITFSRYGLPFELRTSARSMAMVYDRSAVQKAIAKRTDPPADFARAELAVSDAQFSEAATLLKKCLATISSEDVDFRAAINQQLFAVHQRLVRSAVRAGDAAAELDNCLGMSRTCSTLAEEIETMFALSEACERKGDPVGATRCLRTIIDTYGRHEYPISSLAALNGRQVLSAATDVLDRTGQLLPNNLFERELGAGLRLAKAGLPLYLSTVSPLPKTLTLRAGERAAAQLIRLQAGSPAFAAECEKAAAAALDGKPEAEQMLRLWAFPGTAAAQKTLDALCRSASALDPGAARQRLWRLADAARVGGLKMPPEHAAKLGKPQADLAIATPQTPRLMDFSDAEGASRLVLARRDDQSQHGELMFIGAWVRKKVDNKFILTCLDLTTGQKKWETAEIRLKGTGQEPGFFEAFVVGERVIVHGLYDVLAYTLAEGKELWRYRVPFDFEIRDATLSGDLLVLSGKTETLALYLGTDNPNGELAWQVAEMGDLYCPPYLRGEQWISVRKMPFSVTVRYRTTGRLIGRLDLPDLSLFDEHPLIEHGPEALPIAHCQNLLAVTDGAYYVMVDTDKLAIRWKRLIDANDPTREPPMRLSLSGDYLCVLKQDFDQKSMYMLSAKTGEVLWGTDPKKPDAFQPMYGVLIDGATAYGIVPHPGQGFYLAAVDCATGRRLYKQEYKDYQETPAVALLPRLFGSSLVVRVEDRENFEVRAFNAATGANQHTLKSEGVGPFGVHGRMSMTIQGGRVILMSKDQLQM